MYEIIVALNVTDHETYGRYREGMTPILKAHGGAFRYDFKIEETLKSASDHPITRVFAINFPDRATKEKFFANPDYLAVRGKFYDKSVAGRTIIADYDN